MKYIFNPFSPPPANPKSHVRGWAMHWAECLDAQVADKDMDISDAKTLYLDHGVNFGGGLNLFGGVTSEVYDRLEALTEYTGPLVSLDRPMPNYCDQLAKRIGQDTCDKRLEALLPKLRERMDQHMVIKQADLNVARVAIGDSHATAYADIGSTVLRTNGQTLYGALRDGYIEQQLLTCTYPPQRITIVFGSIDIRHHIGRQPDPMQATIELARSCVTHVAYLSSEYMLDVEVAAPVPVEHEGRKIPQTGFYKGTPFCGSRAERSAWTNLFIDQLQRNGVNVVHPPWEWYRMDPELYAKRYMEMGSSVHISPMNYRRLKWGS